MNKFILAVAVFVLNISADAVVQTDTHTYTVANHRNKIVVTDRKTGQEQTIKVVSSPTDFVIYNDFGYAWGRVAEEITVVDLKTNTIFDKISLKEIPYKFYVYRGFGYTFSLEDKTVYVVDLRTNKVVNNISEMDFYKSITFHEEFAYITNYADNFVYIVNLTTNKIVKRIPVALYEPSPVFIYEGIGYVLSASGKLSVIDLNTQTVANVIDVGIRPFDIVFQEEFGYVVNLYNQDNSSISVIDLKNQTVTSTIPIGDNVIKFFINEGYGYVLRKSAVDNFSVIDLKTQMIVETISLDKFPDQMAFCEGIGYVWSRAYEPIYLVDLKSNKLIGTRINRGNADVEFSDMHIYLIGNKLGPLYPTLASLQKMKDENRLSEFVSMNPKAFDLGKIEPRAYPKQMTDLDLLPPYTLAQNIFWDLESDKPIIDPVDVLANLTTMMYPQRFLQSEAGRWLRKRLHLAFFQVVWLRDKEKGKEMARYFIQLGDPVITKLATFNMIKPLPIPSGATNSTSK